MGHGMSQDLSQMHKTCFKTIQTILKHHRLPLTHKHPFHQARYTHSLTDNSLNRRCPGAAPKIHKTNLSRAVLLKGNRGCYQTCIQLSFF
eukprot:765852-Hanusia_phi.AAC.12